MFKRKVLFFFSLSNTILKYFHNLSKSIYFFLTILFTVIIGKSIFIYIFFLIKHICLLLRHHLRELSCCNCLVIVVEKDHWSWSLMLVVVLHALWGKGGKSGENFGYQGLSIPAMTFKQTIKINPSLTIWNIWLCKSKKPTKSAWISLKTGERNWGCYSVAGENNKIIVTFRLRFWGLQSRSCANYSLYWNYRKWYVKRAVYIRCYNSLGLSEGVTPCICYSGEQIGGNHPHVSSIYLLQKSF